MNILKKVFKGFGILLVCLIILPIFLLFIGVPLVNEIILSSQMKEFKQHEFSQTVEILDTDSVCLNFSGTGNHLDYLCGMLVSCEQPLTEAAKGEQWRYSEEDVVVIDLENESVGNILYELSDLPEPDKLERQQGKYYYLAFMVKEPPNEFLRDFDIRGH